MTDINIGRAQRLSAPCPFALLTTLRDDGATNVMAVSWWNGEFGLCIVGEDLKDAALRCGQVSGRKLDKAAEFGIPLEQAAQIKAKLVSGCRVVFECRLVDTKDVGDHTIYIAEPLAIRGDESVRQLFAFDGYARLGTVTEN